MPTEQQKAAESWLHSTTFISSPGLCAFALHSLALLLSCSPALLLWNCPPPWAEAGRTHHRGRCGGRGARRRRRPAGSLGAKQRGHEVPQPTAGETVTLLTALRRAVLKHLLGGRGGCSRKAVSATAISAAAPPPAAPRPAADAARDTIRGKCSEKVKERQ